jgi:hypothetical protein
MQGVSTTPPSLVASVGSGLSAYNYLNNGLTAINQTATTLAGALSGNDFISLRYPIIRQFNNDNFDKDQARKPE